MPDNGCTKNCPCDAFNELKAKVQDNTREIKIHEKRLAAGDTAFELLRKDMQIINTTCTESNKLIKEIQQVPMRRIESVVENAIRWVVPLILGWLISQL